MLAIVTNCDYIRILWFPQKCSFRNRDRHRLRKFLGRKLNFYTVSLHILTYCIFIQDVAHTSHVGDAEMRLSSVANQCAMTRRPRLDRGPFVSVPFAFPRTGDRLESTLTQRQPFLAQQQRQHGAPQAQATRNYSPQQCCMGCVSQLLANVQ